MSMKNSVQTVLISASSSGDNEIVAASAGAIIELIGFLITSAGAVNYKWRSATTDKTGAQPMINGVPHGFKVPKTDCILGTVKGEALNLNLSGSVAVAGFAIVRIVDSVPSA